MKVKYIKSVMTGCSLFNSGKIRGDIVSYPQASFNLIRSSKHHLSDSNTWLIDLEKMKYCSTARVAKITGLKLEFVPENMMKTSKPEA